MSESVPICNNLYNAYIIEILKLNVEFQFSSWNWNWNTPLLNLTCYRNKGTKLPFAKGSLISTANNFQSLNLKIFMCSWFYGIKYYSFAFIQQSKRAQNFHLSSRNVILQKELRDKLRVAMRRTYVLVWRTHGEIP